MSIMLELDPRLVVVGGLVIIALFWEAPLYAIVIVVLSGGVVHARQQYKRGWRVVVGLKGLQFVRQTRQTRLRSPSTSLSSQKPVLNISSPKSDKSLSPSPRPWGHNVTVLSTPVLRPDYFMNCHRNNATNVLKRTTTTFTCPNNRISPNYSQKLHSTFQDSSKMGTRNKVDMPCNKPDIPFSPICDEKYVGVGIYPTVNLNPQAPLLLTCLNTTMTKNRVTVKIAPPDKGSKFQPRYNSQHDGNIECRDEQNAAAFLDSDALKNARKRPIRDTIGEKKFIQKKAKVDPPALPFKYISPDSHLMPNGLACRFGNTREEDSMKILPPSFETDQVVSVKSCNQPTVIRRAQTNAISSSYSSSRRMARKEASKIAKRKVDDSGLDSLSRSGKKTSRGPPETELQQLENIAGAKGEKSSASDDISMQTPLDDHQDDAAPDVLAPVSTPPSPQNSDNKSSSREITLAPTKGLMSMHIPRYIPSLNDYLEDKKVNQQRLQKMLNSISSRNVTEDDSSKVTSKPEENQSSSENVASESASVTITVSEVPNNSFATPSNNVIDGTASKDTNVGEEKSVSDVTPLLPSFASSPPTMTQSPTSETTSDKLQVATHLTPTPSVTVALSSPTSPFTASFNPASYSSTSNTLTVVTSPSYSSVSGLKPFSSPFAPLSVNSVKSVSSTSPQSGNNSLVASSASVGNIGDKTWQPGVVLQHSTGGGGVSAAGTGGFAGFSSLQSPPELSSKGFNFGTPTNVLSPFSSPVTCLSNSVTVAQAPAPSVLSGGAMSSQQSSGTSSTSASFFASPFNSITSPSKIVPAVPSTFSGGSSASLVPAVIPGSGASNFNVTAATLGTKSVSSSATTFAPSSNFLLSKPGGSGVGAFFAAPPSNVSRQSPATGITSHQQSFGTFNGTSGNNFAVAAAKSESQAVFQNAAIPVLNSGAVPQMTTAGSGNLKNVFKPSHTLPAFNNSPSVSPFGSQNSNQASTAKTLGGFAFSANSSNLSSQPSSINATSVINSTPSFGFGANNSNNTATNNNNSKELSSSSIFTFGAKSPPLGTAFGASQAAPPGTVTSPSLNNNNNNNFIPTTNALPAFGNTPVASTGGGFAFGGGTATAAPRSFGPGPGIPKSNSEFQFNSPSFSNPTPNNTFTPPQNSSNSSFNSSNLFNFGSANASATGGQQGFQFNPSSKPTFNFAPSGPSVSGGSEAPMFSIGSTGSTSARRSKLTTKSRSNR